MTQKTHPTHPQPPQLDHQFTQPQFKSIISQLLTNLQITISTDTAINLSELYKQIAEKGNGKVTGRDILSVVGRLTEDAVLERDLEREISYYLGRIQEFIDCGRNGVSFKEFMDCFVLQNQYKGIVTAEIQQKLSHSQYSNVSINKLLSLIQTIDRNRANPVNNQFPSRITQKSLKLQQQTLQLSQSQQNLPEYHPESHPESQSSQLHQLTHLLKDNIIHEKTLQLCLYYLNQIQKKMQKAIQVSKYKEQREEKLMEEIYRMGEMLLQKERIVQRLCEDNSKWEREIEQFQTRCQEDFIQTITKITQENQILIHQRQQSQAYIKQLLTQLQHYKTSLPLNKTSTSTIQRLQTQSSMQNEQSQFLSLQQTVYANHTHSQLSQTELILKAQLKDAYVKLNKLRKEVEMLRERVGDLEVELYARGIGGNQGVVSGGATDRAFQALTIQEKVSSFYQHQHNHTSGDINASHITLNPKNAFNSIKQIQDFGNETFKQQNPKDIFLGILRKQSCTQLERQFQKQVQNSKQKEKQKYKQKQKKNSSDFGSASMCLSFRGSDSKRMVRSITKEYFQNLDMDLDIDLKQSLDFSTRNTPKPQTQHQLKQKIKTRISEYDFVGIMQKNPLNTLTHLLTSTPVTTSLQSLQMPQLFTSHITIINPVTNVQVRTVMVVCSDRFLFCEEGFWDSGFKSKGKGKGKDGVSFMVKMVEIGEIVVCEGWRSWIVIKMKGKEKEKDRMGDLVFMINRTTELLKYLLKYAFYQARQSNIKITFKNQRDILIKTTNPKKTPKFYQIPLTKIKKFNNIVQRSIYNTQNLFQTKTEQPTLFSRPCPTLSIVTPLGLLIFQSPTSFPSISRIPAPKYLLPWSPNLELIDLSQQSRIKFVYAAVDDQVERSFFVSCGSRAEARLMRERIVGMIEGLRVDGRKECERFCGVFGGVRRMRSVVSETSLGCNI